MSYSPKFPTKLGSEGRSLAEVHPARPLPLAASLHGPLLELAARDAAVHADLEHGLQAWDGEWFADHVLFGLRQAQQEPQRGEPVRHRATRRDRLIAFFLLAPACRCNPPSRLPAIARVSFNYMRRTASAIRNVALAGTW